VLPTLTYDDIRSGEPLTVAIDGQTHVADAVVGRDVLAIHLDQVLVIVATRSRRGAWKAARGVEVRGHQPTLF
jgi:hypothetical protein